MATEVLLRSFLPVLDSQINCLKIWTVRSPSMRPDTTCTRTKSLFTNECLLLLSHPSESSRQYRAGSLNSRYSYMCCSGKNTGEGRIVQPSCNNRMPYVIVRAGRSVLVGFCYDKVSRHTQATGCVQAVVTHRRQNFIYTFTNHHSFHLFTFLHENSVTLILFLQFCIRTRYVKDVVQHNENEMGGACSTHGRQKRCI